MSSKKLVAERHPPSHFRRIVSKWDRIALGTAIITFGVWSYFLPPERNIGVSLFFERVVYIELVVAAAMSLIGILGNWYWPTKIGAAIVAASLAILTIYTLADGVVRRGELWLVMMTFAMIRIWNAERPYKASLPTNPTQVRDLIAEFRNQVETDRGTDR